MTENPFNLNEKAIIVTGGYGHLGQAVARGVAENGANTFVLGRDEGRFRREFEEQTIVRFVACDVRSTSKIRAAFAKVAKDEGGIDVLINNAFYSRGQNPESVSDEDWAFGIDGILSSVYRCIREVLPFMKPGGKIINTSSMYGMVSPDFRAYDRAPENFSPPHYGAAKAGILQLTRYFAVYLAGRGIRVNAVTPGAFPNDRLLRNAAFTKELERRIPLGRIGRPDDLKGVFIFLSSSASDYITGQNIVVDGGWTVW